jgi:regulatory protein
MNGTARAKRRRGSSDRSGTLPAISDAAWRLLSVRARSRRELEQRLRRKGFEPDAVERELDRLQELGYLDDAAFAGAWIASRQTGSSPRSTRALTAELRAKGIDAETLQPALAEIDDRAAATVAAYRQAGRLRSLPYPEFRKRLYAFLQRRGFGYEEARRAAEEAWQALDLNPNEPNQFT